MACSERNSEKCQIYVYAFCTPILNSRREELVQDRDDAPQHASDRHVEIALSQIDLQELAAVRNARQRIHDEDYGLCVDCTHAIPFARLKVEPQAQRCVVCESIYEWPPLI